MAEPLFRVDLLIGDEIVASYEVRAPTALRAWTAVTVLPVDARLEKVDHVRVVRLVEQADGE